MGAEIILSRDSIPAVEFREYETASPARPTIATVREIDFDLDDSKGELSFFYSKADFRTPVANAAELQSLLTRIRDNTFLWDDDHQKEPKIPYASRLSLRNHEWCYVIFRLARSKKWQFCRDQPPFTLGTKAFKTDLYREARRFEADGTISKVFQDPPQSGTFKPQEEGSRVAYFIADNTTSGDFEDHGFNIHVDLLYQGSHVRLPIVIDPDIRWPGGSGA